MCYAYGVAKSNQEFFGCFTAFHLCEWNSKLCFLFSCDEDKSDNTVDERVSNKNSGTECGLPTSVQSPASPAKQNQTFICVSKAMPVQFSTGHVAGLSAAAEQPAAPCSTPPPALQGTTLQERINLEMSVLRRQEAVLKLQEEYYTLKIKRMRKQMEETLSEDWSSCWERLVSLCDSWLPVKCERWTRQKSRQPFNLFVLKLKS